MAFDRKQYGMNSGIPFIKIADRVQVSVKLKAVRVSGPCNFEEVTAMTSVAGMEFSCLLPD
jgi:hypothetical protein